MANNRNMRSKCQLALLSLALFFSTIGTLQASVVSAAGSQLEVGFSPEGSAENLVLKLINSAKSSINLAAYGFTSAPIVRALIDAKKRGVNVMLLVDYKSNLNENRSKAPRRALNLLASAGVAIRTISIYPIHHDKYIVADALNVETGSYNYTKSAAKSNSENVLVIWNNTELAKQYLQHWNSRWNQGEAYQVGY